MQTITTKYFGPGNRRGARIRAAHTAGAHTVTLPWDHEYDAETNHRRAAVALAVKLGWDGEWIGGCLNARQNVYVLVSGAMIDGFRVDPPRVPAAPKGWDVVETSHD